MERRYRSKKVSAMQQSAVIEQRSSIPANLIVQNSKSGQTLTKVALRCPSKKSIQVYFCFLPWLVAVLCWPSGAPSYRPRSTTLGACHASSWIWVSSRLLCSPQRYFEIHMLTAFHFIFFFAARVQKNPEMQKKREKSRLHVGKLAEATNGWYFPTLYHFSACSIK